MTCTHVLDLIDAGPFVDYPQAHLDVAWEHARGCATCGPALAAAASLTRELDALPEIAAPPHLAANVVARIARLEPIDSANALARSPRTASRELAPGWSSWAPIGGIAAGLAIVLLGYGSSPTLMSFRGGSAGLSALASVPDTTTGALVLAAGLTVYVAGLFAPLKAWRRL